MRLLLVHLPSYHTTTISTTSPPHLAHKPGAQATRCPSPLTRDVGPSSSRSTWENAKGWRTKVGARKWETQVCHDARHDESRISYLVVLIPHAATDRLVNTLHSRHTHTTSPHPSDPRSNWNRPAARNPRQATPIPYTAKHNGSPSTHFPHVERCEGVENRPPMCQTTQDAQGLHVEPAIDATIIYQY
jgi:hypothetical protein